MKTPKPQAPEPAYRAHLEPNVGDDVQMSLAISAKRQADALGRIAKALEAQNDIARNIAAQIPGGE